MALKAVARKENINVLYSNTALDFVPLLQVNMNRRSEKTKFRKAQI